MRSGTSKGLFLHRRDLPASLADWAPILLAAMGSRDGDLRQLDGLGGGTSTTSKVVVVGPSTQPGVDVEYTFVQVAVGKNAIDMTGNCGNMCSGVAAFALDEGLVAAGPAAQETVVRVYNTNTASTITQTIQVDESGLFREDGSYIISGVKSTGSPIMLTFEKPQGSMTGRLFPTGAKKQTLHVKPPSSRGSPPTIAVEATLIDAANPFVFVDARSIPQAYKILDPNSSAVIELVESIRRAGAVAFGLAPSLSAAGLTRGTPKIALLSPSTTLAGTELIQAGASTEVPDIQVLAYSMGKVHPSLQLTGAVTLAAALVVPGTVAAELACLKCQPSDLDASLPSPPQTPEMAAERIVGKGGNADADVDSDEGVEVVRRRKVLIRHGSGNMDALVDLVGDEDIRAVTVFRTARRLFQGTVLFGTYQ